MTEEGRIDVRVFTSAGFGQNAYLVRAPESRRAVAVDPGGAVRAMGDAVAAEALTVEAILLTHSHVDHVEGVAELVRRTGAPVYLHPDARPLYDAAGQQAKMFGMPFEEPPPPDHPLRGGDVLEMGGLRIEVRDAPGHAPGHVVLYVPDAGVAFVGDVVFQGSIGRTDLPGGNFQTLMRSIREAVLSLPDETVLYSGHGPATTVGHERVSNPFLVPDRRGGFA